MILTEPSLCFKHHFEVLKLPFPFAEPLMVVGVMLLLVTHQKFQLQLVFLMSVGIRD
jgi:hypothetical protein